MKINVLILSLNYLLTKNGVLTILNMFLACRMFERRLNVMQTKE